MKLMKATLGRLWRLTRMTSTVVGLAVMLALVAGVASLAVAKPPSEPPSGGETAAAILKGVTNTATAVTTLINSGTGAALNLQVQPGNPPLTVNPEAGTATNLSADKLDGKDSTAFVSATNGKAPDSELLDGKDSTEFLGAGAKAADSDKLDGKDSADFAAASTGQAFYSEGTTSVDGLITKMALPKGEYVITGSVTGRSHSEDINDDTAVILCQVKIDGTNIASTSESPGTFTQTNFNGNTSLSTTTVYSANAPVVAELHCNQLFNDVTEYQGKLTAIRVSAINPAQ